MIKMSKHRTKTNGSKNDDWATTYELFEDIQKAFDFAKKHKIRQIDIVKANNTYYEEDGTLNYEDNAGTIKEGIISNGY